MILGMPWFKGHKLAIERAPRWHQCRWQGLNVLYRTTGVGMATLPSHSSITPKRRVVVWIVKRCGCAGRSETGQISGLRVNDTALASEAPIWMKSAPCLGPIQDFV